MIFLADIRSGQFVLVVCSLLCVVAQGCRMTVLPPSSDDSVESEMPRCWMRTTPFDGKTKVSRSGSPRRRPVWNRGRSNSRMPHHV